VKTINFIAVAFS